MITDVEDFFAKGCGRCARFDSPDCSARKWAEGLAALRALCRNAGLEETVKWGHPCYIHAGRNIALIGAFKGDFRLTFCNAALMKDSEAVLERAGPNSQTPSVIRFQDASDLRAKAALVSAYLAEAMGYAEAGVKPPRTAAALDLPEELVAALDDDPALAEAFFALTPGRQRSYAIALASAKKPETRIARIDRFRAPIFAGKGATER